MEQNKKSPTVGKGDESAKLTVHDGILAVFYLIVLVVGIILCASHGQATTVFHVIAITICICGITAVKLIKYKGNRRKHIGELIFLSALTLAAVVACISWVIV